MLRAVLDARLLLATLCAAAVGVCGLRAYPFDRSDVFLAVIEARRPDIAQGLAYGYATLWFSTPFCLASLLTSLVAIVVFRRAPHETLPIAAALSRARGAAGAVARAGRGALTSIGRDARRTRSGSRFRSGASTPA